ncbi:MAG: lytic transglycosylase domain-containing protein [Deltaproteobacteria bacterium]|nr:lytic transglycosylase domain-containing protein [Deltaproteobacteria bacterium]
MKFENKHESLKGSLLLATIAVHVFFAVLIFCCAVGPVQADVYVHIDDQGVYHFTDAPPNADYKIFIRSQRTQKKLPSKYDRIIAEASERFDVSFPLLKAMVKVESDFDAQAISQKGALGLMQIMPANVFDFKISDPFDPYENVMAGAGYFKTLLERFEGHVPTALAAYNAGPGRVDRHRGIPPITETKDYISRVLRYRDIYGSNSK